jgi:drug/metabolite transporter (DMT)-like permease
MLRSFLGTFSLTIWFFAIAYLPLGTSMTLNYTSPLYMALIVAAFALKRGERPDMRAIAAVVAGFAGVTLVLKPELHSGQEIPALVGLSSGFFSALAYFQIRQLTNLREPDWRIVFYFTLFGTVWGGAGQLLLNHGFTPLSAENVPALLGMGLCATGAQLAMTRAWGSENILLSAVFQYAAIIFAAVFGVLFFKETIGLASAAGIAVILVSGVWAAWSSRRAKAKAG